jgi:hypothetical protein
LLGASASAAVGVTVHVNKPGAYGRVDIGNVPVQPSFIYDEPMIISQPAVVVERRPIYLHVPPGHARHWRRYCGRYNACGQPVYFVRQDWYRDHYVPHHAHRPHPGYRPHPEHRPPHVRPDHGRPHHGQHGHYNPPPRPRVHENFNRPGRGPDQRPGGPGHGRPDHGRPGNGRPDHGGRDHGNR